MFIAPDRPYKQGLYCRMLLKRNLYIFILFTLPSVIPQLLPWPCGLAYDTLATCSPTTLGMCSAQNFRGRIVPFCFCSYCSVCLECLLQPLPGPHVFQYLTLVRPSLWSFLPSPPLVLVGLNHLPVFPSTKFLSEPPRHYCTLLFPCLSPLFGSWASWV